MGLAYAAGIFLILMFAGLALRILYMANLRRNGLYPQDGEITDDLILDFIRRGDRILAIKAYRTLYGTGLKDAKERVEELAAALDNSSVPKKSELDR